MCIVCLINIQSSDKPSESRRSRDMDVVDEEVDSEYLELTDTSVYRHSSSSNCEYPCDQDAMVLVLVFNLTSPSHL